MKLKYFIVIIVFIILIPVAFLLLRNASFNRQDKPDPNSLDFFEKTFVFNSLTFKAQVKSIDKVSISVVGLENKSYTLPLASDLKVYRDQNQNGLTTTVQVDNSQATDAVNKEVTLVLNKDDAGTYRVSIIHLP